MGFYDDMAAVATDVLTEFKQGVVQLVHTVPGTPDPSTPWQPGAPTVTTYDLAATVKRVDQRYENGALIVQTGDIVTFAVPAVVPGIADTLIIDGVGRAITNLKPVPSAGTPVAYVAFCAV